MRRRLRFRFDLGFSLGFRVRFGSASDADSNSEFSVEARQPAAFRRVECPRFSRPCPPSSRGSRFRRKKHTQTQLIANSPEIIGEYGKWGKTSTLNMWEDIGNPVI
eukprot:1844785-Pyramimonas_sp.AAC.1